MPHGTEPTDRTSPRPRCRSLMGIKVVGVGSYVPDLVVTNDQLHAQFGFDSDWIVKRTGIYERRHAQPEQATSDLAAVAIQRCIANAGIDARDIDLLLCGTFTPDCSFPSTACMLQDRFKLTCPAVDLQAACAGFMYAYITAATYVLSGASDMALVVGADCNSRILNPNDIKTYPLFGDGAGAFLMTRGNANQGILSYSMGSDGHGADQLIRRACGSRLPPTPELLTQGQHYMYMDGRAVFRWAVAILCDTIQDVLKAQHLTPGDVDLYVPHQANIRIINAACDVLHIPRNKVFTNLDRYGNTSAGSIPLAIDEALATGRLKDGDLAVLSGFGAGLTWGTALVRW
ncbi:MAG: beta-ketoacyl-ACP synthase III [Gemmataceae bacterium]